MSLIYVDHEFQIATLHVVNYRSGDPRASVQANACSFSATVTIVLDLLVPDSSMAAMVPDTNPGRSWRDQVVPKLPESGKGGSKPAMSTIFLVRHGDYHRDSKLGQHLTIDGKAQAHRAGKSFQEQGIIPTKVYHSNLPRSVETADIILTYFSASQSTSRAPTPDSNFDVVCSHLLREVSFNPVGTEPMFKVHAG